MNIKKHLIRIVSKQSHERPKKICSIENLEYLSSTCLTEHRFAMRAVLMKKRLLFQPYCVVCFLNASTNQNRVIKYTFFFGRIFQINKNRYRFVQSVARSRLTHMFQTENPVFKTICCIVFYFAVVL